MRRNRTEARKGEQMNNIFLTLLNIAVTMSIVIALLLLLRGYMKKKFTARCRYIIWAVVMIRLCIPVSGFVPSLFNIEIPKADVAEIITESEVTPPLPFTSEDTSPSTSPSVKQEINEIMPADTDTVVNSENSVNAVPSADITQSDNDDTELNKPAFTLTAETLYLSAAVLWLVGAVVFIAFFLIKYNINIPRLNNDLKFPDARLRELYSEICTEANIKKPPKLYVSGNIKSPLLYGFFSSKILLPELELSDASVKNILHHELTHHKRGDIYLKLASMVGNALHWFNPLAYAAAKTFEAEMELSCDEKVLSGTNEETRVIYGRVMLEIAKNSKEKLSPLSTSFYPKKGAVKERISSILDMNKKRKGITAIVITVVLCIIAGTVIGITVTNNNSVAGGETKVGGETSKTEDGYRWSPLENDTDGDVFQLYCDGAPKPLDKCKMKLIYKESEFIFDGIRPVNAKNYVTEYDFTGDGTNDFILTLCTNYGTNINENAMFAFDGKKQKSVPVDDIPSVTADAVSFEYDDENFYVTVSGTKTALPAKVYENIAADPSVISNGLHFGQVTNYLADSSGLYCHMICYADNANLLPAGIIEAVLVYKDGRLAVDTVAFKNTVEENTVFYETSDPEWKLYYNTTYLVLESPDGRKHKFGDTRAEEEYLRFLGIPQQNSLIFYPSDSQTAYAYIYGDHAVITYNTPRYSIDSPESMSAMVVDLNMGLKRADFGVGDTDIVAAHGYEYSLLDAYRSDGFAPPRYTISMDIRANDDAICAYTYLETDDGNIHLSGYEEYKIKTKTKIQYYPTNAVLKNNVNSVTDINDLDKMWGIDSGVAGWVRAFINKDIKSLEELTRCSEEGVMNCYSTLEFGDYKINRNDEDGLILDIYIKESDIEFLPAGQRHQIKVSQGYFHIGVDILTHSKPQYDKNNPALIAAQKWHLAYYAGIMIYSGAELIDPTAKSDLCETVYDWLSQNYGPATKAEYRELAAKIFRIDQFEPNDFNNYTDKDEFSAPRHGGPVLAYDVTETVSEGNTHKATLQFYADFAKTVKSHKITYEFAEEDGLLVFVSCTMDSESEYNPASYAI